MTSRLRFYLGIWFQNSIELVIRLFSVPLKSDRHDLLLPKKNGRREPISFFAEIQIAGSIDSQNFSIRIKKVPIGTWVFAIHGWGRPKLFGRRKYNEYVGENNLEVIFLRHRIQRRKISTIQDNDGWQMKETLLCGERILSERSVVEIY